VRAFFQLLGLYLPESQQQPFGASAQDFREIQARSTGIKAETKIFTIYKD
jgi:hypothetical protein